MASSDTTNAQEPRQVDTVHFQHMQDKLELAALRAQGQERPNQPPPSARFNHHGGWRSTLCIAFAEDIPPRLQRLTKCFFAFYVLYVLLLIVNIAASVLLPKYIPSPEGEMTQAVSIPLSLVLVVAAYLTWYRLLYKAFRNGDCRAFIAFLACFMIQIILCWIVALGIPNVSPGFAIARDLPNFDGGNDTFSNFLLYFGAVELFHASVGKLLLIIVIIFWRRFRRQSEQDRLRGVSQPIHYS